MIAHPIQTMIHLEPQIKGQVADSDLRAAASFAAGAFRKDLCARRFPFASADDGGARWGVGRPARPHGGSGHARSMPFPVRRVARVVRHFLPPPSKESFSRNGHFCFQVIPFHNNK